MMSPITPNLRTILVLGAVAALVVAGVVFRQEKEMGRLRAEIAELTSHRSDGVVGTNPLPADIEELRPEASEVQRLRAEIAQLRRETMETSAAIQARVDKVAMEVSAISANFSRRSGLANTLSLAQSSPEEAARSVAAMPVGNEQNEAALAVIDRWIRSDPGAAAA